MVTPVVLTLLMASASTIAFTPQGFVDVRDFPMDEEMAEEAVYQERPRRGTSEVTKHSISSPIPTSASSASFASSESFSGSIGNTEGNSQNGGGYGLNSEIGGGDFGSYAGYYGVPAYHPLQTFNKQRPNYMQFDFYSLFQQFFRQLQIMAQQQAYAANYYTPSIESNTVDYETAHNSDMRGTGGSSFAAEGTSRISPVSSGFPYGGEDAFSYGSFSGSVSGNGGFGGSGSFPGTEDMPAISADGASAASLLPPGTDVQGAAAIASLSPQGGFGYADVYPNLASRFGAVGGEFPKPSGNSYGVFTSSSSGSSDINGKKTSFKTATTGVNDNGKITVFTKHDP